ncbi:MAG: tripartite tricarboxylate transporter substrate-binding protein [Deltaproteobacteria bacterium]|nr:tripartite tricarboxylate transporter substrate-binding protein [Deltaproteobacteria bacterium]
MKKNPVFMLVIFLLWVFLACSTWTTPRVWAQSQFYKDKTVRIVVGFSPGGFYDRWSRLLARYMGRYIPGNPNFVVQNMPGAGSRIAANYLYNIAKRDGLTIGTINKNLFFDQLIGTKEVRYDWSKYNWLGTPELPPDVFYMRSDAPFKSLDDIKNASTPPKCGSTGRANSGYLIPALLEKAMGIKFKMVLGYKGGRQIDLAVERGEVVCRAMSISAHFGREPFLSWHKKGFDWHLLQTREKPWKGAPDIPSIFDIAKKYKASAEDIKLIRLAASTNFGKPFTAPPGVSKERVAILRKAFSSALRDPQAVAEGKKLRMEVDMLTGRQVQKMAKEVLSMPREVVDRFKKLVGE